MYKVKQYDWDKLRPTTPEGRPSAKPKPPIKKYKKPVKFVKRKKLPKDYHLGRAISHLKSIMRED